MELPHIRKYGKARNQTECGAPATKNDVRAAAWLRPFPKCDECRETIRRRLLTGLARTDA